MTTKNPFEKFWKDQKAKAKNIDKNCNLFQTHSDFLIELKADLNELLESQAKKTEREVLEQKKILLFWETQYKKFPSEKVLELIKSLGGTMARKIEQADAFRLVQGSDKNA